MIFSGFLSYLGTQDKVPSRTTQRLTATAGNRGANDVIGGPDGDLSGDMWRIAGVKA